MNTSNASQPISTSMVDPRISGISAETQRLLSLGEARGWDFQVLGRAPMPHGLVRIGDWLVVPAGEDSTPIRPITMEKLQTVFATGFQLQGFVVVHEAPKLLKAPPEPKQIPRPQISRPAGTAVAPQSGSDALAALGSGLAALASMIFPMLFFVVAAAMADPILVAVSESGEWIEIDRWWTE